MLGIICGGGDYPRLIAQTCYAKNIDFCLVFLDGFCDVRNWPDVKTVSAGFGQIGKIVDFFHKNGVKEVVFAGNVRRPDFSKLSLDKKGMAWLLKLGKHALSGDDELLRAVAELLTQEGFEVKAGTDYLEDIFVKEGTFSERKLSPQEERDVQAGLKAARDLGAQDKGQAVIVCNEKIIATEDINGTDNLITRSAKLRKAKIGGVLVKVSKPQQDGRLDLPTIGINTIENLHKNGFAGVAVECNKCIVLNKKAVIDKINEYGMFFISVKSSPLKVFIIAGEASGDYLGGRLMQDISDVSGNNAEFFGIGGDNMVQAGLRKLYSTQDLSIIGIWEVLGKIFHVKKMINETVKNILQYQPNVIVTIDSSGFTHRVAKKLKKLGCRIPIVHYVAPPVWAWRKWRAKTMHNFIDKLMTLFPFEPELFNKYKLNTVFVGHPIATDSDFEKPDETYLRNFQSSHKLDNCKIITLLPGSRGSEVEKHMPILEEFTRLMSSKYKDIKFIIPTIPGLQNSISKITAHWEVQPIIVTSKAQKILAYYSSCLAIAASGTVTLELARVGLPTVIIYKTSRITYHIVKFLIHVSHVGLINILAGKTIVPELLQEDCTAENIFKYAQELIDTNADKTQKKYFKNILKTLVAPKQTAAIEVIKSSNFKKF